MTYRYLPVFLFMLIGSLLASCNKDSSRLTPTQPTGNAVISAYINGEYWELTQGYAQLVPTANMQINGSGTYGDMIIAISPFNGIQTYNIDGFTKIMYTEGGVQYNSIRGQIQVTANHPDYIEGNFNCELVATTGSTSLVFTNGQFSVSK